MCVNYRNEFDFMIVSLQSICSARLSVASSVAFLNDYILLNRFPSCNAQCGGNEILQ